MNKTEIIDMAIHILLVAGILSVGILIIQFLINAGKKAKKDDPHALGLPQGSVRALLAISLIVFFILIALFFYFDASNPNDKSELAESILTILGTLVIAVTSFYFGVKATEQGSKIAKDTFKDLNNSYKPDQTNIPPIVIQEAISQNKEAWRKKYNCMDIKLGKKKSGNTLFELNCITFIVPIKSDQLEIDKQIPSFISYSHQGTNYNIFTDIISEQSNSDTQNLFTSLPLEEQYQIVEMYIENEIDVLLDTYESITGVSAAKKQRNNTSLPLVCLQLQVAIKSDNISQPIPKFLEYNNYQIPTDVVEAGITKATFSLNPVKEGVSRLNDDSFGSLGFPVYHNNELHILSCYHVLFSKELNQGKLSVSQATNDTSIVSTPHSGTQDKVGDIVEGMLTNFLDVALMKPTRDLREKYEKEGFSTEYAYLRRDQENVSYFKFFGSKSQKLKKPDLLNIATLQPVEYTINGRKEVKRMRGLIQLEKAALKGDSGAALYDYRDHVVGIIVASDSQYSYAISAHNIFKKTNYSLNP